MLERQYTMVIPHTTQTPNIGILQTARAFRI